MGRPVVVSSHKMHWAVGNMYLLLCISAGKNILHWYVSPTAHQRVVRERVNEGIVCLHEGSIVKKYCEFLNI